MASLKWKLINVVLPLFIIIQLPILEGAGKCPTGFTNKEKYCYLLKKDPEKFSDKFVNCDSNLYTLELYKSLSLPKPDGYSLWTDYKSLYPGGPFVDWSYTSSIGSLLGTSLEVNRENDVSVDDELCVVIDAVKNFSMVRCDARNYRYCVVEADSTTRELEHVNLTIMMDGDRIKLTVSYDTPREDDDPFLTEDHIKCFTDSSKFDLNKPSIELDPIEDDVYTISSFEDGYYWCTHMDSKNFYISESNKFLYIKPSLNPLTSNNLYAVKIKTFDTYTLNMFEVKKLLDDIWMKTLIDYVFYSNKYIKSRTGSYDTTIMNFKNEHTYLHYDDISVVKNNKLKRLYLDAKTVLLHVELHPDMKPVKPGQWESILIEYMRPVYYCDEKTKFGQGMNYTGPECKLYKCEGDYNEGLETITTKQAGCSMSTEMPTTAVDVATTTVDTGIADTPHDRLEELINELKTLVNSTDPLTMGAFHDVFKKPGDPLALVVTKLKEFLNSTDPIMLEDIEKVFTQVDNILVLEGLKITGNFLQLIDDIGARLDLNGLNVSITVRDNIALLVADAQPHAPVKGLQLVASGNDAFTKDTFTIVRDINGTRRSTDKHEVVVSLPNSVATSNRRVSFVVFRDARAFQGEHYNVNSRVVSVKVENLTRFSPDEEVEIHLKPKHKVKRNQNSTCAFWKFNDDNTGSWSQEGCIFIKASEPGLLDICRCNHLTHFAEILISRTGFSKIHENILEKLSIIGCCVSILGLLLVGLTAALFRSWRRDYSNKIWLQLSTSILILSLCFLVKVFVQFEEGDTFCPLTGVVLHYFVLSSFCWMLVAAVVSYRKLVAVFSSDPTHKLLRAAAFAWGAPFAVVSILFSVAPHSYGSGYYVDKSPSFALCYPSGLALWIAVKAPITLMLLTNLTLFVLIVRSLFGKRRPNCHSQSEDKEAFRCAFVSVLLVFLFGIPWIFGLLSSNVVCAYLFTIFVAFQGVVLFFLFVCNTKTRDLWLVKLKLKQAKIPVMTSTTTDGNRSMGVKAPLSTERPLLKKRTNPALSTS